MRAAIDEEQATEALAAVTRHAEKVAPGHKEPPYLTTESGWDHDGYVIVWRGAHGDWVTDAEWPDGVGAEAIDRGESPPVAVALLPAPYREGCPDCGRDTLTDDDPDEPLHCTECGWSL